MDPCNAIGKLYCRAGVGVVFECVEYDPGRGYLMVPRHSSVGSRYVSERAIGRTMIETR